MALLCLVARKDMIVCINPSHTHTQDVVCLFVTREDSTKPIPDREKEMTGHTPKRKYHLKLLQLKLMEKEMVILCAAHI